MCTPRPHLMCLIQQLCGFLVHKLCACVCLLVCECVWVCVCGSHATVVLSRMLPSIKACHAAATPAPCPINVAYFLGACGRWHVLSYLSRMHIHPPEPGTTEGHPYRRSFFAFNRFFVSQHLLGMQQACLLAAGLGLYLYLYSYPYLCICVSVRNIFAQPQLRLGMLNITARLWHEDARQHSTYVQFCTLESFSSVLAELIDTRSSQHRSRFAATVLIDTQIHTSTQSVVRLFARCFSLPF